MAVQVSGATEFNAGTPEPLFQGATDAYASSTLADFPVWDVTSDGKKFLIPTLVAEENDAPFNIIVNWTSLLDQ